MIQRIDQTDPELDQLIIYHMNSDTPENLKKKVITDQVPTVNEVGKIGRNETCICGSGKKYKKCCGKN